MGKDINHKQSSAKQTRSHKDEDKAQRREDIIDAAETAFFATHFDKVSIGSIAKGAGLSRALIYVYFEDKADIYRAIMVRASAELNRRFIQACNSKDNDNGLAQIKALGYAYYGFYREKPEYFHMLTDAGSSLTNLPGEPSEKEQKTIDLLKQTYSDCMKIMVQALATGLEDGSVCKVRGADPVKAAYFLRGMLHGVLLSSSDKQYIDEFCDFSVDELIDYCIGNANFALSSARQE